MAKRTITLRLTIDDPVPGVRYSLQDRKNAPIGAVTAANAPLSFDVAVELAPGSKLGGSFVRREGPVRRFVYIAIGGQAGDTDTEWSRRAKIDVHEIAPELLEAAEPPRALACRLPGRANDGGPACATVHPLDGWHLVG